MWKITLSKSVQIPAWRQDNDFLRHGHRPNLPSFPDCFASVFRVHTETGNIWTHIVGAAAVVAATATFFATPIAELDAPLQVDRIIKT
jgi:adiponectin receptor